MKNNNSDISNNQSTAYQPQITQTHHSPRLRLIFSRSRTVSPHSALNPALFPRTPHSSEAHIPHVFDRFFHNPINPTNPMQPSFPTFSTVFNSMSYYTKSPFPSERVGVRSHRKKLPLFSYKLGTCLLPIPNAPRIKQKATI